ncbi:MAG: NAD-dependent epimerase/dehydratase family protein [Dehalococcoidia bacterium]|nr:NAD-dependent epimerase/dehydratase family protein [Dehalococcoidia bacterium]
MQGNERKGAGTMHVLVTGATGFVGSHITRALIDAGHQVRLMVRLPERIAPALGPLGIPESLPYVIGDITDPAAVGRAVDGCDAVVHAASVYSLSPRSRGAISRANVGGTQIVLNAALEAGLDPIVHISSYGALLPPEPGATLDTDSPTSTGLGPYTASKADAERLMRVYQGAGNPVVTVMPGSVWGPDDPHFGESHRLAWNMLKGRMRLLNRGGALPIVDVRDVASAVAACMTPGLGPRRYLLADELLTLPEVADLLATVAGTRRRALHVPDASRAPARAGGGSLQRAWPWRLPLSAEAIRVATTPIAGIDATRAAEDLGFAPRPLTDTVADTVRSLSTTGRIGREAGRLTIDGAAG